MSIAIKTVLRVFKAGLFAAIVTITSSTAWAAEFIIRDIRIEGLQRISEGLVINSLPVRIGQTVDESDHPRIVSTLYEQGYFSDIEVGRDGDVLIVKIVERPSIKSISVRGNRVLDTEALLDGLKNAGLAENKVFNPGILESIRQELIREYVSQGMYQASVETEVEDAGNNQVEVIVNIKESTIAKIRSIIFTGNDSFSDSELKSLMTSRESSWMRFWSKSDRYLKTKLKDDVDSITSFYLDNGFLKFSVESVQVNVDQDREGVIINIAVNEGDVYTIDSVRFLSQDITDQNEIQTSMQKLVGEVYSQKQVTAIEEVLAQILGSQGYAFARVRGVPEFKESSNSVDVIFAIEKGKRSYVRRINFTGNTKTQDHVLRREMRQMESAPANTSLIEQSKVRLQRLGYFKDVKVETAPVPGYDDLVDVNFTIEEDYSGSIGASFGYADGSGLQLGANLQQNNFMGTGNQVAVVLNRNSYQTNINFGFTNPYYTIDGVSRGFNVFYRATDLDEINVSNYSVDRYGGNVSFGYPLSETQRIGMTAGYERIDISTGSEVAMEIENFTDRTGFVDLHGSEYDIFSINLFWRQSSLNRGRFATRGSSQSLALETSLPGVDLEYYKLTYSGQRFFPINEDYTFRMRTKLGYGDGYSSTERLPFFEHFFAGGFNSVRGFDQNTLGPRSTDNLGTGDYDPFGGDTLVELGADLFFPTPFIKDKRSVQTSFFIDSGNVFDTECQEQQRNCHNFDLGEMRYSVGIGVNWQTFLGPLSFSIAAPFNENDEDDTKVFQFSIGTGF